MRGRTSRELAIGKELLRQASRLGILVLLAGAFLGSACGGTRAPAQTIVIHYSHFSPPLIQARAGEPGSIVIRNEDPIEHEWIVGPDEVHQRHRTGSEALHDEIPTEVTVPALSSKATTVTFSEPGDYAFICHLPGHEEYGMRGVLRVVKG